MFDFWIDIAEIMDFGYPQNLSPEILKLYITQEGVRSPFSSKVICIFCNTGYLVWGLMHVDVVNARMICALTFM